MLLSCALSLVEVGCSVEIAILNEKCFGCSAVLTRWLRMIVLNDHGIAASL